MAFPTVTLIDGFSGRPGESPLSNGGKWVIINGCVFTGATDVSSGYTSKALFSEGEDGAYWNVNEYGSPIGVSLELSGNISQTERLLGVWTCLTKPGEATKSGYRLKLIREAAANTYKFLMEKCELGTFSTLAEKAGVVLPERGRFGLLVEKGIVSAWMKETEISSWTEVISKADTKYTKGFIGISVRGSGTAFAKNFEASNLVSGFEAKLEPRGTLPRNILNLVLKATVKPAIVFIASRSQALVAKLEPKAKLFLKIQSFQAVLTFVTTTGPWKLTHALRVNNFEAVLANRRNNLGPGFPTLNTIDNFNRANEDPISNGGKWTQLGIPAQGTNLKLGRVLLEQYASYTTGSGAEQSAAVYWNPEEFTRPAIAAKITGKGELGQLLYLFTCVKEFQSGPGETNNPTEGYMLELNARGTASEHVYLVRINKIFVHRITGIAQASENIALDAGTLVGMTVSEGKVKVWKKPEGGSWEVLLEVADSTYKRGFVGLGATSTEKGWDTFEAISQVEEGHINWKLLHNNGMLAILQPAATLGRNVLHQFLTPALSFVGKVGKAVSTQLSAELRSEGRLGSNTRANLAAALSFAGNLGRAVGRPIKAVLTPIGKLAPGTIVKQLGATFTPQVALFSRTRIALQAATSFVGNLTTNTRKNLVAKMTFIGSLGKNISVPIAKVLSFTGTLRLTTTAQLKAALTFTKRLRITTRVSFQAAIRFFVEILKPPPPRTRVDYVVTAPNDEAFVATLANGRIRRISGVRYYEQYHSDLDFPQLELTPIARLNKQGELPE